MQHNNPAGADCQRILVVLQRLLTAAQQERYTALVAGRGHVERSFARYVTYKDAL